MAANNSFIPASELQFDAYKNSLKTFLAKQERFKDYNFEGTNLSVLLDVLTYNTVNNALYLNMVGSEAFLDSARLRASIVSRAKELNYTPRSRISAHSTLTVEVVPSTAPSSILLPKDYKFKATSVAGQALHFVTTEAYTLQRSEAGRYVMTGVEVFEGELVTETFDVVANKEDSGYTSYQNRFVLQSENIDATSIEVKVYVSEDDTNPELYTRAYNVYGLSEASKIFFVRGYKANQYEVEFGDGTFGFALETGYRVAITYRDTVGDEGNGRIQLSHTSAIDGFSNVTVTVTEFANGGAERESNESIQFNAPRHYQTQERGVIDTDFKTLLNQNFPEVQDSHVYGGENVKKYGYVIVAIKPIGSFARTSSNLKKRIKSFLETKTLTTKIEVEDPTYFILRLDIKATYDLNLVQTNTDRTRSNIITALKAYEAQTLARFGVTIFMSKLEAVVEASDPSVVGCVIEPKFVYQWVPATIGRSEPLMINTNNPLDNKSTDKYAVRSGNFYTLDSNGNPLLVYVQDDRDGKLRMYRQEDDTVFGGNVGTVNYTTGVVSANILASGYDGSAIDWVMTPADRKLSIDLNQFTILDSAYLKLTMVQSYGG